MEEQDIQPKKQQEKLKQANKVVEDLELDKN
jgi:hypothetical protein